MSDLARPPESPAQKILRPLLYVVPVAFIGAIVAFFLHAKPPALDDNLCPKDSPPTQKTILLLDVSDPLTPKHRAELERIVSELQRPGSTPDAMNPYVAPGEELIVYQLAADWQDLKPAIRVCNPGNNPDDWNWGKDLTQGKAFARHNWQRFEEKIKQMFPDKSSGEMPRSPILESLSVIVPRHAPSKRDLPPGGASHTYLILFSDLLQHSDSLSHYEPYPKAEDFLDTPKLRELATDLTRVRVTIFRLERSKYSNWQTVDHYYWWPKLIKEFKGKVRWHESV